MWECRSRTYIKDVCVFSTPRGRKGSIWAEFDYLHPRFSVSPTTCCSCIFLLFRESIRENTDGTCSLGWLGWGEGIVHFFKRIYSTAFLSEGGLSVCLCLSGFGGQTTGWIPTKFGLDSADVILVVVWPWSAQKWAHYLSGVSPNNGAEKRLFVKIWESVCAHVLKIRRLDPISFSIHPFFLSRYRE